MKLTIFLSFSGVNKMPESDGSANVSTAMYARHTKAEVSSGTILSTERKENMYHKNSDSYPFCLSDLVIVPYTCKV